ncbi:fumarylacetoacetate hydrolase family protein [Bradyrhizobium jicamae]|uniref:fumarylacetoacetate hydrolase family protein n=1 Tax=Bradyrhizobium jicamae TaxID=280332 RepID=UPI001BA50A8C|nr:fumarylacetoacetate hydrolase family protein [Bradyrhizobium jicamae]MBR0751294.1 fumarylacetoacetate hydrolase family protein [Bradyrhizobium jicamae]
MRFVSLVYDGIDRVGVIEDAEVLLLPTKIGDLVDLIAAGETPAKAVAAVRGMGRLPRVPLEGARLLAPIRRYRRDVLCIGWNYWDHFEEGRGKREGQEVDKPKAPTFFTKSPDTVIGPNDDIAFDTRISAKWDYEAELALVIGKPGRSIPTSRALDHVFGYCLANDVSQRDLQRRHGGQWLKGKSIDGTMPIGPYLVTPDELDLPNIRLESVLNGEVMQSALVKQMAFPIAELIAELSFGMTLHPGDVILTGTPAGVGNAREPQVFMQAGDEIVVRGSGLGELRNRLVVHDLYGLSDIPAMDAVS